MILYYKFTYYDCILKTPIDAYERSKQNSILHKLKSYTRIIIYYIPNIKYLTYYYL